MILVNEGSRRIPLVAVEDGRRCSNCGASRLVVAVSYQVFGFFDAFAASWSRRYALECRQCRAVVTPLPRAAFEQEHGNPIPYGHRYGLPALATLLVATIAILAVAGHGGGARLALLGAWTVVGIGFWRTRWMSAARRRRMRRQAGDSPTPA